MAKAERTDEGDVVDVQLAAEVLALIICAPYRYPKTPAWVMSSGGFSVLNAYLRSLPVSD